MNDERAETHIYYDRHESLGVVYEKKVQGSILFFTGDQRSNGVTHYPSQPFRRRRGRNQF